MREQRSRLIFIDETVTTTKMRGRSVKGQRLNSKAPFGHWGTQTFVAGLKCDGFIAPWVIDAPMNRTIFETYVETQLVPILTPGDASSWTISAATKANGQRLPSVPEGHDTIFPASLLSAPWN